MKIVNGMIFGFLLAGCNWLLCHFSLKWAYSRSNGIFYGTFFGGMIWKLAVLGLAFLFLRGQSSLPMSSALIALALATFFLNLVEARLVCGFKR